MNADAPQIPLALVIDDEIQVRRLLKITLESNGYRVAEAVNGRDGLAAASMHRPNVVILDLGLPDMDGLAVLKHLREWSQVPVLVLSVRDREEDKVSALDNGANDYVTKPFGAGELLARLRAAQRNVPPAHDSTVFRCGPIEIDLASRIVRKNGKEVKLTATEYSLLRLLVRHAGKVVTHRQILREVWGPEHEEQIQYLRVYIAHVREKIETTPAEPEMLITESGIGYRFIVPADFAT